MSKFSLLLFLAFGHLVTAQETSLWPPGSYVPNVCICGSANQCAFAGAENSFDGSGMIQGRILTNGSNPNATLGSTNSSLCQPVSTGINLVTLSQDTCDANYMTQCCPVDGYTCGIRFPPVPKAPTPSSGQAAYGAYPFQVIVLEQVTNNYIASGVLIDQLHVLTVAHKVSSSNIQLKVRLGDWDAGDVYEPLPTVEVNVTVFIHPKFTASNLKNNIAILRLQTPVTLGQLPTIGSICLPNTTLSGLRCWVSGVGKNATDATGRYQRILKEVDVPLVDSLTCVKALRTKLGNTFALDRSSFLCAGGEEGKDACIGDGGAPLSCFVGSRFYLVGLSAWGVSCGLANMPSVYVNIQTYIPWIQNMTSSISKAASSTTTAPATVASASPSTSVCFSTKPLYDTANNYLKTACLVFSPPTYDDSDTLCTTNNMRLLNLTRMPLMPLQVYLEEIFGYDAGPLWVSGKSSNTSCSSLSVINKEIAINNSDNCSATYASICEFKDAKMPQQVSTFTIDTSVCGSASDLRHDNGTYVKTACLVALARNYSVSDYVCKINGMKLFDIDSAWTLVKLSEISVEYFEVDSGAELWVSVAFTNGTCTKFYGTGTSSFVIGSGNCGDQLWSYCQYADAKLSA